MKRLDRRIATATAAGGLVLGSFLPLTAGPAVAAHAAVSYATTGTPGAASEQAVFAAAATRSGVPETLLLSVSYNLTRWEAHGGEPSTAGGFGPMHLVGVARGDARGDTGRRPAAAASQLARAAALAGLPVPMVATDPAANIRAGAALLAADARQVGGGRLPTTLGGWYAAVARYGGSPDTLGARQFADDVYATLRTGARRVTADGQVLRVAATPADRPDRSGLAALHLRPAAQIPAAECPRQLDCRYVPAAYAQNNPADNSDYGNYDIADRPAGLRISYIVIHDTEGLYDPTIALFQDSHAYVTAHYVIRSSDGQVTQVVPTKDVAWHAGNWYVNSHSIGIEHEGFAAHGATWYTEALYRSSATLVRYLATRFGIPLDRAHILGHDNVPGVVPSLVAGMHWDPGPFWDWAHYMQLLGRPLPSRSVPHGNAVVINPVFAANRQPVTGCGSDPPSPSEPASFVHLHTGPSEDAPLLSDAAIHPDGAPGTIRMCDTGDKASTGQQFALAGHRGDWTAIWYGGQLAWLHDIGATVSTYAATVTVAAGGTPAPVYGRAYPEAAAYAGSPVPPQSVVPLQYTIGAGQHYVVAGVLRPDYYHSNTVDGSSPGDRTVVTGRDLYYLVYFGHRMAYVRAADVILG